MTLCHDSKEERATDDSFGSLNKFMTRYGEKVWRMAKSLNLSDNEIRKRKSFLRLTPEEEQSLRILIPFFQEHLPSFTDRLHDRIDSLSEISPIQGSAHSRPSLRMRDADYFLELVSGEYGTDYVLNRLAAGISYHEIGLGSEWVQASFGLFLEWASWILRTNPSSPLQDYPSILDILLKITFLDSGFVMDSYFMAKREHIEILSRVFETNAEGVWIVDRQWTVRHANRTTEKILGWEPTQLEGKSINEIWGEESGFSGSSLERMVEVAAGEGHWEGELFLKHQNGNSLLVWGIVNVCDETPDLGFILEFRERDPGMRSGKEFFLKKAELPLSDQDLEQFARESPDLSFHHYGLAMDFAIKKKIALRLDFGKALKIGELDLHYQPIINIRTNSLIGVESLLRWNHPERGLLVPSEFLPDIQGTEQMVELGEWVLNTALHQLSQWLDRGFYLSMSVNVDLLQLKSPDFVGRLEALLSRYPSVPRSLFKLEILETSTPDGFPNLPEVLGEIHAMGVRLVIDDFGTGYSSLSYLKHLPVDMLKIDQGFVIGMRNNRENLAIIESIVSLARIFGRSVVAEGLEEMEYVPLLLKLGCEYAQGNAIGRPMRADEFLKWSDDWIQRGGSETLLPLSNRDELSILSAQIQHFAWIHRILSLVQKSALTVLTPSEEAEFSAPPVEEWYVREGRTHYGEIPAFRELDNIHQESRELALEMLRYIREKNLEGMHYDTHRMLLTKDSMLALYGTLQKDAILRSILDRKGRPEESPSRPSLSDSSFI